MPRLLNYLTAPNVLIWSAVAASCAIPGVYRSSPLMFKDKNGAIGTWNPSGHKWIDGSVENDLPMARISELFGVNHFIVAQVNPHVLPAMRLMSIPYFGPMIKSASFIFWSEVQHWLTQVKTNLRRPPFYSLLKNNVESTGYRTWVFLVSLVSTSVDCAAKVFWRHHHCTLCALV